MSLTSIVTITAPAQAKSKDSNTVKATLTYFTPPADGSKPWVSVNSDPITGEQICNYKRRPFDVEIENLRGKEKELATLDGSGFQFVRKEAECKEFGDDRVITEVYYKESEELIKQVTGASRVVFFDHTIRRRRPGEADDGPTRRQPVPFVHVDQTNESAIARVHRHLPASDVPSLLAHRFQIINLWRPITHTAIDFPLALCDFKSINYKEEMVPTTLRYPDRDGETFSVKFSENHKWKYLRGMQTDEAVLIKCFDSVQDGSVAILTPHTAFNDPTTPKDAPLRESIELRALVFYD